MAAAVAAAAPRARQRAAMIGVRNKTTRITATMSAEEANAIRRERAENARAKKQAYDARPDVKQRKLLLRYQDEHEGVEPVHQMQAAPIAQKYAIPVEPRAPLVVEARNLMGKRGAVLVRAEPPLAIDPAHPFSWASMMGWLKQGDKQEKTYEKHRDNLTMVFKQLGVANPETIEDVTPYFNDANQMIEAVGQLRQVKGRWKGEVYAENSRFGQLASVTNIARWGALRLISTARDIYAALYKKEKKGNVVHNQERVKDMTAFPWSDIMAAVKTRFPALLSDERMYVTVYNEAPTRDNMGDLHIVEGDDDIKDTTVNYLCKWSQWEGAMCLFLYNFKTRGSKGLATKKLSDSGRRRARWCCRT